MPARLLSLGQYDRWHRFLVSRLDLERNQLVIGPKSEMGFSDLVASQVDFVAGTTPAEPFECDVMVRYRGERYPARIEPGEDAARVHFTGDMPSAVAPGQAVVFYRGDEVLGGGTIQAVEHTQPFATSRS
jgi:tRNA-uridine 2-sulfurtransferase